MKIVIVGGLGYLGTILTDLLSKKGHEVIVIDSCFWGNNAAVRDISLKRFSLISLPGEKEKFFDLLKEEGKIDKIIWACDMDVPEFYSCDLFGVYLDKMMQIFVDLCKSYDVISFTDVFSVKDSFENERRGKINAYFEARNELKFSNFIIPCLFGASIRMRWDLLINSIFLSLILDTPVQIKNWRLVVPFCSVVDFCNHVIEDFKPCSKIYCQGRMSIFEIIKILTVSCGKERELNFVGCENVSLGFHESDFLITSKNADYELLDAYEKINKQLELGMLPDFQEVKYNNAVVIESLIDVRGLGLLEKF
jgi:hypothetical protein